MDDRFRTAASRPAELWHKPQCDTPPHLTAEWRYKVLLSFMLSQYKE